MNDVEVKPTNELNSCQKRQSIDDVNKNNNTNSELSKEIYDEKVESMFFIFNTNLKYFQKFFILLIK